MISGDDGIGECARGRTLQVDRVLEMLVPVHDRRAEDREVLSTREKVGARSASFDKSSVSMGQQYSPCHRMTRPTVSKGEVRQLIYSRRR